MSNPRFGQPALRGVGTPTPQQIIHDAEDQAKYAQALAAAGAQAELWQILSAYTQARDENQIAARAVSAEVHRRVELFTFRLNDITQTAARAVGRELVPVPRDPAALRGPYQRQVDYSQSAIRDGLASADALVAAALADATEAEAAAIVDLAWLAAAPTGPGADGSGTASAKDRMMSAALQHQVDDALAAIRLALAPTAGNLAAANSTAQRLVRDAAAEQDQAMISALLGAPARRLLSALQVNRTALTRVWAEKQLAAVQVDANAVAPLAGDIHGGAFLRLQGGPQALAKLPALAKAYYTRQRAVTDALLATPLVRENMGA